MAEGASKPSVYIETTIVSYLTSRPSHDPLLARHQQLTRRWWKEYRRKYHLLISPLVIAEAHALRRLADFVRKEGLWLPIIVTPLEMLGSSEEV